MENKSNRYDEDSFVFYPTFIKQIESVKCPEIKARIYKAVAEYGCRNIIPDFSDIDSLGIIDGLFESIRFVIDETKARRRKISNVRSESGKCGGAPTGNTNAQTNKNKQNQPKTNKTSVNVNGNVNVDVNGTNNIEKVKRATRFIAPSLDDVKAFFFNNHFSSDPEQFYYHYSANGWMIGGRTKMKDWEAAAQNWERRQSEFIVARPACNTKSTAESRRNEFEQHIIAKIANRDQPEPDLSDVY